MPRSTTCAATCLTILAIACSPVRAETPVISASQGSLVAATCSQVMGLRPGETYFAACKESLSQSLAAKAEGQALANAGNNCRQQGLVPGTAAFSICVLDNESPGAGTTSSPMASVKFAGTSMQSGKSFYEVAPVMRWNRERYSCAQLGLIPGSAAFGECITSLDGAFLLNPN
jgi:hypothetical protein